MDITHYYDFLHFKKQALGEQATEAITKFIDSFETYAEKEL